MCTHILVYCLGKRLFGGQTFHWLNKNLYTIKKIIAIAIIFTANVAKTTLMWISFSLKEPVGTRGGKRGRESQKAKRSVSEVIPICLWNRNRDYMEHICTLYIASLSLCRNIPTFHTPNLEEHHVIFLLKCMTAYIYLPTETTSTISISIIIIAHISHVDLRKNRNWH